MKRKKKGGAGNNPEELFSRAVKWRFALQSCVRTCHATQLPSEGGSSGIGVIWWRALLSAQVSITTAWLTFRSLCTMSCWWMWLTLSRIWLMQWLRETKGETEKIKEGEKKNQSLNTSKLWKQNKKGKKLKLLYITVTARSACHRITVCTEHKLINLPCHLRAEANFQMFSLHTMSTDWTLVTLQTHMRFVIWKSSPGYILTLKREGNKITNTGTNGAKLYPQIKGKHY